LPSPIKRRKDLAGLKVTVMGLGLNGGGLATARFFAEQGSFVTVTDMKGEKELAESIAALEGLPIRFVLGKHELSDFTSADLVIKNPAVKPDSPYLRAARAVESDLSVFLRLSQAPILAITGSKGKSTVSTALHHALVSGGIQAFLGGNIAVSPLSFIDKTGPETPVVLELSSWQLADMRGSSALMPRISLITSIMPDHMNRYISMDDYVADKRLIYADQGPDSFTIVNRDDPWGELFASETKASVLYYASSELGRLPGAWLEGVRGHERGLYAGAFGIEEILPAELLVPGPHQRKNLLSAALAARIYGMDAGTVSKAMACFRGVEHRLEFFAQKDGVRFYNDSAATIPQAVAAAIQSFDTPLVLITGGTDKNLDFEPARAAYRRPKAIVLLAGSGTDKLIALLESEGIAFRGPFGELEAAVREALKLTEPGSTLILSPGCTSFGMFVNEFDRGRKFKDCLKRIIGID